MRNPVPRPFLAAIAALLLLPGCVELTGQRITLRVDPEKDCLQVLISYDGIHESRRESEKGVDQIRGFAADGNVMLLDWFGHFRRDALRKEVAAEGLPPCGKRLAEAILESWRVIPLGHHVDPAGRIGALQLVEIRGLKRIVALANEAMKEAFLAGAGDSPTVARLAAAAKAGHVFLRIEGHSLAGSFPVDPVDWACTKADIVKDILEDAAKAAAGGKEDLDNTHLVQLLCAPGLAFADADSVVTVRIGRAEAPTTLRFLMRSGYNADLESAVKEAAPAGLDAILAAHLLDGGAPDASDTLKSALAWLPPEDGVRAVLGRARGSDETRRGPAVAWLRDFARGWSRASPVPAAPDAELDDAELLAACEEWYRKMLRFPLER